MSSVAFHPYGTFATTGGDGSFCFWDKDARQKLKTFSKKYDCFPAFCATRIAGLHADLTFNVIVCVYSSNQSITKGTFNARGDIFAYTLSYDWCMGAEKYNQNQPSVIRLHSVAESEVKQKKKPGTRSRKSL